MSQCSSECALVCPVPFMPQLKEVMNTPKETQLKAAAQCTAELRGVTTLAFPGCLHLAL